MTRMFVKFSELPQASQKQQTQTEKTLQPRMANWTMEMRKLLVVMAARTVWSPRGDACPKKTMRIWARKRLGEVRQEVVELMDGAKVKRRARARTKVRAKVSPRARTKEVRVSGRQREGSL